MSIRNVFVDKQFPVGNSDQGDTGTEDVRVSLLSIDGSNTPGFKRLKKKDLPANPVTLYGSSRAVGRADTYFMGTDNDSNPKVYRAYGPAYSDFTSPPSSMNADAASLAARRNLASLSDMSVNMAQAFGERKQVMNMLATTATRLSHGFLCLRRGNVRGCFIQLGISVRYNEKSRSVDKYRKQFSSDPQKAAANLWLELQYGWRPLLNDLYGSAEMLANYHVARDSDSVFAIKKIRSVGVINDKLITDVNDITAFGSSRYFRQLIWSSKACYSYRYRVENDLLRYSSMFGMTNPSLLAYELTPFSFVIDWFLPIGKYLEASTATNGLSFVSGTLSIKSLGESSGFSILDQSRETGNSWYNVTHPPSKSVVYNRTPLSSFPANPSPVFKNPASLIHAANAIALLVQIFKK